MPVALAVTVAFAVSANKNVSHAATVADGNVYVDCVVPLPTKISSCPGRTSAASVTFSPPTTETAPLLLVTRPVWLFPKMNSRATTKACAPHASQRSATASVRESVVGAGGMGSSGASVAVIGSLRPARGAGRGPRRRAPLRLVRPHIQGHLCLSAPA